MRSSPTPDRSFSSPALREFPRVGDYRVRLVACPLSPHDKHATKPPQPALDVREYIETERFTGWTRRAIRIYNRRDAALLAEALRMILDEDLLPEDGGPPENR